MMAHCKSRQAGVAIIAVLMVAALVASVGGLLMLRQQRALQQLEIRKDTAEARAATWSVLQLVRLTLRDDARQGLPDHLLKPWAIPIPEMKVENGGLSGRLIELNGRFNLNNLLSPDGKIDELGLAAYRQLLLNLGLPAQLADALEAHWRQQQGKRAVVPQPLLELNELAQLSGYNAAVLQTLEPYVVALPARSSMNVNFVSAEVLAAYLPKLGVSRAEQVLAKRRNKYFASTDEFLEQLPAELRAEVPRELWGVKSSFFWADMGARFGVVLLQHRALLDRSKSELPTVLWMRRVY
ncbi:type II secretion system minor pseudopilin GspK [Chitinibacter fontanus]|uniref:Type II secretion system protein K n=1 Tax=Chitinibacter fontanus TaxID=1737446 RepID=A0A7D5V9P0_9NEIS|nr:type II secretion system minor pseudopilin GspK [Chitinibacter fontanus]QLI81080.1 type II secretion system minor pseudopilin GspK [Chitinibacter fontanus]